MNNETSYVLFQIISFKKYFYVSLGNIFYCFVEAPLVVEALGNCPVCPPLNPAHGPAKDSQVTMCFFAKLCDLCWATFL